MRRIQLSVSSTGDSSLMPIRRRASVASRSQGEEGDVLMFLTFDAGELGAMISATIFPVPAANVQFRLVSGVLTRARNSLAYKQSCLPRNATGWSSDRMKSA